MPAIVAADALQFPVIALHFDFEITAVAAPAAETAVSRQMASASLEDAPKAALTVRPMTPAKVQRLQHTGNLGCFTLGRSRCGDH